MKTVANLLKPELAHLLRMRLEASGIRAVLQDENSTQMDASRIWATGGVRLQVADADLQEALRVLGADQRERAVAPAAGNGMRCLSCDAPMGETESRCPACGWSYEEPR